MSADDEGGARTCVPDLSAAQQERLRLVEAAIRTLDDLSALPFADLRAEGIDHDAFDYRRLLDRPIASFLHIGDASAAVVWRLIEARHAASEAALTRDVCADNGTADLPLPPQQVSA